MIVFSQRESACQLHGNERTFLMQYDSSERCQDLTHAPQQKRARLSSSKESQADAAAVGNHEFSVTQSGVEVVQDPELSKDDRPLWVAVGAFDLAVFEFEHVAARGVHLLTRGRQLA